MHISENFLPYESKTIILVCDRLHAKVYQAHDREFNFVEEITDDRLPIGEAERYTASGGGHQFTENDEGLKEREAHVFYAELAKKLFEHKHKAGFEKLILVVPHEDKNVLIEALHDDVKRVLDRTIPKQLTKVGEDQVIEAIDAERRTV